MSDQVQTRPRKRKVVPIRPRTGKIPTAVNYSGIPRSKLYELAPYHPGLFLKFDRAVLINFDVLDQIIDALPVAEIKG